MVVSYAITHQPYIAITFDDGPGPLTAGLIELLARYQIKATFFVIGGKVAKRPEVVARASCEDHAIGNHTWSHPNLKKILEKDFHSQLQRTDDVIKKVTGKRPTLMRPPYGSYSRREH